MEETKNPGDFPENNFGQPQVPPTNFNSSENTYWESQASGQSQEVSNPSLANQKASLEPPVEYGEFYQNYINQPTNVVQPQNSTSYAQQTPNTQTPDQFYQNYQQQYSQNQYSQYQNPQQQNTQPTYTAAAFKPQKKKSHGKLIAACIVFLIIISGGVAAYANRGSLINTFSQMTKSPAEYYAFVEGKAFSNAVDDLIPYYDGKVKNTAYEVTSDVTLDRDTIDSMLQSSMGMSMEQLESMYGLTIENFGFNFLYGYKDDIINGNLGFRLNQVDLITMEIFSNTSSQNYYMRFPELSSAYLNLSLSEEDLTDTEFKFPNSAETVDFLKRYGNIVIDNLSDVQLEKNSELTVDTITTKCSKITVTVTDEDCYNILMDFLEEARDDEYLIDLTTQEDLTKEEYQDGIDEAKDDLIDSEDDFSEGSSFQMIVYVDNEGNIIGRDFSSDESLVEFGYHNLTKGDTNEYDVFIKDDEGDVVFDGSGSQTNNNGAYDGTGTFTVTIPGEQSTEYSFDLEYEDMKTEIKNNRSYEYGTFSISSPELYGIQLTSESSVEDDTQKNTLSFQLGSSKLVTVDTTVEYLEDYEVEMPSENEEVYDYTQIDDYTATLDIEQYLSDLSDKLGFDLSSFLGLMQSSDDYYYDY